MCSPSEMSSTSISSSDSAILIAQQKTGPRGMGVGIVRGDLGMDRAADQFASFHFNDYFKKRKDSLCVRVYGRGVRRGGRINKLCWVYGESHQGSITLVIFKCSHPGSGVLWLIFAGYVPLASQNPSPIIVYSVANYRPHLSHF